MSNDHRTRHLTDDQMIDLLINPERNTGDVREHLPCDRCTPRIRQLQADWLQLQTAIDEVDLPSGFSLPTLPERAARTPVRRIGWAPSAVNWRLAAGICLLFGAGAVSATTPLGAWVADWLGGGRGGGSGEEVMVRPAPQLPPEREGSRGARISFPIAGSEMVVELVHRQGSGRVILYPVEEPSARIELAGATGAEMPLVREGGVQIRNTPGSGADYRIGVPAGVARVRVRAGGGPARVISRRQIVERGVIELGANKLDEIGR